MNDSFRKMLETKSGLSLHSLQHKTSMALAVAAPAVALFTFVYQPAFLLRVPFDLVLALAGPLHGYIGLEPVFTDYVTWGPLINIIKFLSLLFFVLAVLGLLKLALVNGGISEELRALYTRRQQN